MRNLTQMKGYLFVPLFLLIAAFPASSQEIKDDTNPTKPVFLSLREEYYRLGDNLSRNFVVLRSDKVILSKTHLKPKGMILRWDLHIARTSAGAVTQTGLGDLYMQSLLFPLLGKFTFVAGSGFVLPTATDSQLGRGKWQMAPLAAPLWFFPQNKGFFFVKFQDFFSFAGNGTRSDVHYFLSTATVLWRYTRKSWVLLDTETKTNWELDNATSYRSGIQLGTMLSPNIGLWIKPEIPWAEHREGSWALKFTFLFAK